MQTNWIGKSKGLTIKFIVKESLEIIEVSTTRPDTLMGVSYLAIAPEHPLALEAAKNNSELAEFIENCKKSSTMEADLATQEKSGFEDRYKSYPPYF